MKKYLLVGLGQTNLALASALQASGGEVIATDDFEVGSEAEKVCEELSIDIHIQPSPKQYFALRKKVDYCIPTPGLLDSHVIYKGINKGKFLSELDIAASLVDAQIIAITGTNGKSTVVELVKNALTLSGIKAVACGNTETSFVQAAIENPNSEVFVVEASSFALRHCKYFAPQISAWLNFAPNHLDIHKNLKRYKKAKTQIWKRISKKDYWIANSSDAVVMKNQPGKGHPLYFDGSAGAKSNNKKAASLIAAAADANPAGITESLENFKGLPHRMEEVVNTDGITWFNDTKATTPHAVKAGLAGLGDVVLIAGGRDKSGSISTLNQLQNLVGVVAIGESAAKLEESFSGKGILKIAESMQEAVLLANDLALASKKEKVSIVLSPGGASFDWYSSYQERGEDFKKEVKDLLGK